MIRAGMRKGLGVNETVLGRSPIGSLLPVLWKKDLSGFGFCRRGKDCGRPSNLALGFGETGW